MCDEPFSEVSQCLTRHDITQDGDSALTVATRKGRTDIVSLVLEAGANIHVRIKVRKYSHMEGSLLALVLALSLPALPVFYFRMETLH